MSNNICAEKIMEAREARWLRRCELSRSTTLVTFTMNVVGEDKLLPVWLNAHLFCSAGIEDRFSNFILKSETLLRSSGMETHWLVSLPPENTKEITVKIEETHTIGRLLDIDVMFEGIPLSRKTPRLCLCCRLPAKECKEHRLEAFQMGNEMIKSFVSDAISSCAVRALLAEASLFPKPGLVTPFSTGAHTDMDFNMLLKSAFSLKKAFYECTLEGIKFEGELCELLPKLRKIGIRAERTMLEATRGVNTHKGALFLLGLLCASLGLLSARERLNSAEAVCKTAGQIVDGIVAREMDSKRGGFGARGEAESGFALTLRAFQVITELLSNNGKTRFSALSTLFSVMRENIDTNVIARSPTEGLNFVRNCANSILSSDLSKWSGLLRMAEKDFVKRNISPGGSADILSCAFFLTLIPFDSSNS